VNQRSRFQFVPCLLVLLLLAAGCAGPGPTPPPTAVPIATQAPLTPTPSFTPTPTPNPHVNPLTGEGVTDPEVLQHRPLLVRYGHDRIARPPSGLDSADLVYEELAEGHFITRLTGGPTST